jgi:hypothetical protein
MNKLAMHIVRLLGFLPVEKLDRLIEEIRVERLRRKYRCPHLRYISQGTGGLLITGTPGMFTIDPTSHLKSGTYIECTGGVTIGSYFHVGRGLTIVTRNHNFRSTAKIPYDEVSIPGHVKIKDFVWCGANVTILPGVTVGEGAIIGACSVITKDIPDYAIVAGNPAREIGRRDVETFLELKAKGAFLL